MLILNVVLQGGIMPLCIVYGPRDVDVVATIAAHCPTGTILRFNGPAGVVAVLPEGSDDTLRAQELHLTVREKDLHEVAWLPFIVRRHWADSFTNPAPILDILQEHFSVRARPETRETRDIFEFPVPVLPPDPEGKKPRYDFRDEVMAHIARVMEKAKVSVEIGLAVEQRLTKQPA